MSVVAARHPALVHDWLTGMRGGEMVLEALATLWPQAPIYTLLHVRGSVSEKLEAHPIHTSFLQRAPGIARHYRRYLPFFPSAIEDMDLGGHDLIVSTSHCVAKGIIPDPDAFHVCYCHTPMRYAWDQEHTYFPQRRGLGARLRNLALTALRGWDTASATRVDAFIANSHFVARRIQRYYGRSAEVIAPPVDCDFFTPADEADDDAPAEETVLMVSALAPYKRVDLAIAACEQLGIALHIVGDGPERRRLQSVAGPRTRFLGHLSRKALRRAYRDARLFLQPGIEDFGIASVEALACGTPVVALGRGGILDIVEDGEHGVLYGRNGMPAGETEAIKEAIDKCRQIRFNSLKLRSRAQFFSTAKFIERVRSSIARRAAELEVFHDPKASP